MTTPHQALELLREIRALERLAAAIEAQQAELVAAEWRFGLVALTDRLRWLRHCFSGEDPTLVDAVVALEWYDRRTGRQGGGPPAPTWTADVPDGGRIH